MSKIKILKKEVGKNAEFTEIENSLEAMQAVVGGYIETVTVKKNIVIVCDEEARLSNKHFNISFNGIQFFGDIFFCGVDGDEFTDLPEEDFFTGVIVTYLKNAGEKHGNDKK